MRFHKTSQPHVGYLHNVLLNIFCQFKAELNFISSIHVLGSKLVYYCLKTEKQITLYLLEGVGG